VSPDAQLRTKRLSSVSGMAFFRTHHSALCKLRSNGWMPRERASQCSRLKYGVLFVWLG
jgi:hypothetical protein